MRTILVFVGILVVVASGSFALENLSDSEKNWPQWRGPLGTGAAPAGNPPIEWSEQQNIRWKTQIPGIGYATPVIWGNDIFIASAIEQDSASNKPNKPIKFVVIAIDRLSGKLKWQQVAREEVPHEGMHPTGSWAAYSPVTDGERVYFNFGSHGLYCYDIGGKLLWEKDFGDMKIRNAFGEGGSPTLYKNRLIVNWDHEGQSFIVALDAATGKEVWKMNRDDGTSWMTPLVVEVAGQTQVVTSATNKVRSYDLATERCSGKTKDSQQTLFLHP